MNPLCFRVDLPPKDLSPNRTRNVHWVAKSEAVLTYKSQCAAYARNAMDAHGSWETPWLARVSLRWHLLDKRPMELRKYDPRYKPMDPDNAIAASKALFDALTACHALRCDTWEGLEIGRVWSTKESGPFVSVTIEAAVEQGALFSPGR